MGKGISPFLASVMLIAFVITVAALYSGWITSLSKSTTETVKQKSETKITCAYGGISLNNVQYNSTSSNGNMTGTVENTDVIDLGDVDIEVFFTNGTRFFSDLNLTLKPGERDTFRIFVNTTTYDKIRVKTNCSNVDDEITSSSVSTVT